MNLNVKRVVSSLVLFPLVVVLLVFGETHLVDFAFAIIALMALHEYFVALGKKTRPIKWIGYLACVFIALLHVIPKESVVKTIGIALPSVFLIMFLQVILTNMKTNFNDVVVTFFGIFYVLGCILFLPLLLNANNGRFLIWYVLFAAWGTDLSAFIVGRCLGLRKTQIHKNKSKQIYRRLYWRNSRHSNIFLNIYICS